MKLSTKAQYGLKACFYLAEAYGRGPLSIARLSELTTVSPAYLEQLVMPLKRSGLLKAERGKDGGYTLSRPPRQISAGEIVRALEDNLTIIDCLVTPCAAEEKCPTCAIWNRLYQGINRILDEVSLQDMLDDYHGVAGTGAAGELSDKDSSAPADACGRREGKREKHTEKEVLL